jgi:hypothetical protein
MNAVSSACQNVTITAAMSTWPTHRFASPTGCVVQSDGSAVYISDMVGARWSWQVCTMLGCTMPTQSHNILVCPALVPWQKNYVVSKVSLAPPWPVGVPNSTGSSTDAVPQAPPSQLNAMRLFTWLT